MKNAEVLSIQSCLGERPVDSEGSPVGVVRMEVERAYTGTADLLMEYINSSSPEAWEKIKIKIDYIFDNLNLALNPLDRETNFIKEINSRVARGQKLLFKPNLVNILNIDFRTHGPGMGHTACTEWPFIAALMRWFHDKAGISYYCMSLGEAATTMAAMAALFSNVHPQGKRVPAEAVIEGRAGDFYGGWGFYFVRKYLAESLDPASGEDPMRGYDESVAGTYIPPGLVSDKLMVYDLNRISDDPTKGRTVKVPGGVNFDAITLHKAVIGGDPDDREDIKAYPGCVLINVPRLKMHNIAIFTNVIKNLGIGLYPMQVASQGKCQWDYSVPHREIPCMKGRIPHQVWEAEIDYKTALPKKDDQGNIIAKKTGGMPGTMADIIKAVSSQGIFMMHAVDAIVAINFENTGAARDSERDEGMVFVGLDPVATDLLCARYVFSNVPLEEALQVDLEDRAGGRFPQKVPLPRIEGNNIVTGEGYDCPLSRDFSIEYAQKRGLGQRKYYVVGRDAVTDRPMVSLEGHLGTVRDGLFEDIYTKHFYYGTGTFCWSLQRTAFNYFEAAGALEGYPYKEKFLKEFDEDGDGIVTFEEMGKKGLWGALLYSGGSASSLMGSSPLGFIKGAFLSSMISSKCCNPRWNPDGYDITEVFSLSITCQIAYELSRKESEEQDPFFPSLTWGKGKWPSLKFAGWLQVGRIIYGPEFPKKITSLNGGMYGQAFSYADLTQNQGRYTMAAAAEPGSDAVLLYLDAIENGQAKPLDFTVYIPAGYAELDGKPVFNVKETTDPNILFTASFNGGQEVWNDING